MNVPEHIAKHSMRPWRVRDPFEKAGAVLFIGGFFAGVIVCVCLIASWRRHGILPGLVAVAPMNPFLWVGVCLCLIGQRRLLARLRNTDYQLCANCLYDLRLSENTCPECGLTFTADGQRDVWRGLIEHDMKRIAAGRAVPLRSDENAKPDNS